MSRMVSRRSRSRSRTPPVKPKPKKVVNMLDSSALSEARDVRRKSLADRVTGPGSERITCTIAGSGARGNIYDRVSGGRWRGGDHRGGGDFRGGDRQVNMRGGPGAGGGQDGFPGQRRSFPARGRAANDDDEEYRRGRREDGDKPVMQLVDPQEVPRGKRFFTHDDRGGEDAGEWRGRDMYDPRKDTGRHDRGSGGRFDRYDRRSDRDFGGRRFERDDRDDRRRNGGGAGGGGRDWEGYGRQSWGGSGGSYSGGWPRSGADGVWTHDKYMELEDEADEKKKEEEAAALKQKFIDGEDDDEDSRGSEEAEDDAVIVVDTSKTERKVE